MAIRFNKFVRPDQPDIQNRYLAEVIVRSKAAGGTMVFHVSQDRRQSSRDGGTTYHAQAQSRSVHGRMGR